MQPGHFTSLLPEQFRHKTTRVRVPQPQVILTDFHGTISERRWEDQVIVPYVERSIATYLMEHLTDETVQSCLGPLRQESFEIGIRHKYEDAPIIEAESEDLEQAQLAKQVADFVLWQIKNKKETKETWALQRLVWMDGFERKQILTPLYPDVMPAIRKWHDEYNCKIYLTSSLDVATLRTLMENTSHGNLDILLSGYLTSMKVGDKLLKQTYKKFYEQTILEPQGQNGQSLLHHGISDMGTQSNGTSSTKSPSVTNTHAQNHQQATSSTSTSATSSKSQTKHQTSPVSNRSHQSSPKSPASSTSSMKSFSSDSGLAKPILFITDSGQEAKAASSVLDNSIFECLLVNRPGNKRIRSYYLTRFQYVDKFDDIEFVN